MNANAYFSLPRGRVMGMLTNLRSAADSLRGNITNVDEAITGRLVPENWRGEAANSYSNSFIVLRDGALDRFSMFLSSYADAIEAALNDENITQQQLSEYSDGLKAYEG